MKTLLLIITLFAFLQSAFLGVNLVLVVLIARSLILDDRDNLYLAFFGGLILSFLTQVNLGYYPLVFMLVMVVSGAIKKLPVSFNALTVFVSGALLITLVALINSYFIDEFLVLYPHVIELLLVVPVYFLVKLWEERFIVKSHTKLRMR